MKYKVGDKIICTCGYSSCPKFFTIINIDKTGISVKDENGKQDFFNPDSQHSLKKATKLDKVLK